MDIPDLVQRALDGEDIQAGVSIGDEDAVCITPTRTLVYRGEGLLSDEQVSEYPHDIEQLTVSEGRRKTKFTVQYIDGTDSFTVPANRGEKVLELFLEGVLRLEGVIESRESILGVYRFSELTVIVTEGRLIKHIGEPVWNEDFEVYSFEDVTRLEFERASVATSIALSIDGRPQRVKVPNDTAPVVRQTLEKALFEYYDVTSIEELNRVVDDSTGGNAGEVEAESEPGDGTGDFEFGDDFDPLVSDDDEDLTESVDADDPLAGGGAGGDAGAEADHPAEASDARSTGDTERQQSEGTAATAADPDPEPTAESERARASESGSDQSAQTESTRRADAEWAGESEYRREQASEPDQARDPDPGRSREAETETSRETGTSATPETSRETTRPAEPAGSPDASGGAGGDATAEQGVSREEFEAVAERLDDLTEAVERQNELLRRQHRAIKQLVRQHED